MITSLMAGLAGASIEFQIEQLKEASRNQDGKACVKIFREIIEISTAASDGIEALKALEGEE